MKGAKVKEWARRYLPAEVLSVALTLLCTLPLRYYGYSMVTIALAGTWGGNIAYYGYILIVDIIYSHRELKTAARSYTRKDFLINLRSLMVEFGVAEVIDSLFIRPALMYYVPMHMHSFTVGVLIAKFAADVCFYIPAIIGYEVNKKYVKRK